MLDLIFRTEDIDHDEIKDFFVETQKDREIINAIKAQTPVVLIGSRGVGKSFLLKIAQSELLSNFEEERILPVYITLNRSSLVNTTNIQQFQHWILANTCMAIVRALKLKGLYAHTPKDELAILEGDDSELHERELIKAFENSWKRQPQQVDISSLPSIEDFKYTIEDICLNINIKRLCIMFDEAIHVFIPEQQRQFFTLFRDIRTKYISCNAAVYPGVTSYGEVFQPHQDASMISLTRDVFDEHYVDKMREIVIKQAEKNDNSALLLEITKEISYFQIIAYASTGNPRVLLNLIARASKFNSQSIEKAIKDYFRTDIWFDHIRLRDVYKGHINFFDWGRNFIENHVLPDLKNKNEEALASDGETRCCIWVQRGCPEQVNLGFRLLDYTGILTEHTQGIRATRAEIGTRYLVNIGCLLAIEASPVKAAPAILHRLRLRRMSEYGVNHSQFSDIIQSAIPESINTSEIIRKKMNQPIDVLDLSPWMIQQINDVGITTVEELITAEEATLREIKFFGPVRTAKAKNIALTAVYEYISG